MNTPRKPSVKTLRQCFADPNRARKILEMTRYQLSALPICSELLRANFGIRETWELRMVALNSAGDFHGVETIETERQSNGFSADEYAEYLNAGDSYAPTVIYWRGKYRVQDVGTFIENQGVKFK